MNMLCRERMHIFERIYIYMYVCIHINVCVGEKKEDLWEFWLSYHFFLLGALGWSVGRWNRAGKLGI